MMTAVICDTEVICLHLMTKLSPKQWCSSVSLTLREGVREVGLAYADVSTRRLGAAAFVDDELLTGLEAAVVQLGAKEAVICKVRDQHCSAPVPVTGSRIARA
jgi:DNA mismatch repair ATPase MutS